MDDELVRKTVLDVPAEMVMEIAAGMEEPFAIAFRYGFTYEQFTELCQWAPFNQQVAAKQVELKTSGHTFRLMNGWMAEDLARSLYLKAKANDASLSQVHEVYKTMSKLADYEPKSSVLPQQSTGFSISINFSKPISAADVVDVTPRMEGA